MSIRTVLVVGAGIAGSTVACLLGRRRLAVTVVERSGGHRSSGSPVDVRGPALRVVERMGLLPPIRARATRTTRLAAVDADGALIGWIPTQSGPRAIEIPRGDLAAILAAAARDQAEFRYDDTVTGLRGDAGGVDVAFEHGPAQRFDLVIGADGLHSTVRRLAFGPEQRFATHLGLSIATLMLGAPAADPRTVLIHGAPGRAAILHPTNGREGAAFIFRHARFPAEATRDPGARLDLLTTTYDGMQWRVPEFLDRFRTADDIYFDGVSRIRVDRWSRGRTVLVGDAAGCVSLLGEGSSMAVVGAATLAAHLRQQPDDVAVALREYERVHRRRLRPHHAGAPLAGHLLVPATRGGVATRDALFHAYAATHPRAYGGR
ncbi:FAD-dependent monooxygenase [Nakamurella sp.]|uniref:FAD-dependent monooxygenase n=1 Tax=Nakamurella sp. TaxID=1869182 RepID=UPI003784A1DD